MVTLYDQFNRPIQKVEKQVLRRPLAAAPLTDAFREYVADGLTPSKLASILKEADAGDLRRQAELFDQIVVVDCLPEQQIMRVKQRDELDEPTIKAIMKKQVNRETRLNAATEILDNSGDIKILEDQVVSLHKEFMRKLKKATE